MTEHSKTGTSLHTSISDGRWPDWHASLSNFRNPSLSTASWQVINTVVPYLGLWMLLIHLVHSGATLLLICPLVILAAAFLVRIFVLFHDCVHDSFFPSKTFNRFFGHILGLMVFTPFDDWRFSHLRHHATYANLDTRGFGDIWTMTRSEYESSSPAKRLGYRLFRNPVVMIGLGALFTFLLRFRLPVRTTKRKERMSVLFTNLLIVCVILLAARTIGWRTYLAIQLPVIWMAGAAGIWLFYVQHQFEGVYWARKQDWNALQAAMEGSSFYKLPALLRWFSASIGYHHVHHLNSRIPNYRLADCYEAVPALQAREPMMIRQSLSCMRLKLWDEELKQLVNFS